MGAVVKQKEARDEGATKVRVSHTVRAVAVLPLKARSIAPQNLGILLSRSDNEERVTQFKSKNFALLFA